MYKQSYWLNAVLQRQKVEVFNKALDGSFAVWIVVETHLGGEVVAVAGVFVEICCSYVAFTVGFCRIIAFYQL